MENLSRLVSESFSRYGLETFLDPRRLQWSQWFRCESKASIFHVPGKPGLFALAEELISAGDDPAASKRMLALFQISEADDLGMTLGRLLLSGKSGGNRLPDGRCYARYAVIDEPDQRHAAYIILQQWLDSSAAVASGFTQDFESSSGRDSHRTAFGLNSIPALAATMEKPANALQSLESSNVQARIGPPAPFPSGF